VFVPNREGSVYYSGMKKRIIVRLRKHVAAALVLLALSPFVLAQTPRTEHTFKLDDPDARPPATLDDVAWLVGSWSGPAFGGTAEEVWGAPSAGSMLGFFKVINGDDVVFYELVVIVEEEGTLSLKVKHFNPDFSAWEEKDEYITFRFIEANDNAIHFSGISFYRISPDELHVYLAMRRGEELGEEKLVYRRTKLNP
jgi:hypothetical protein